MKKLILLWLCLFSLQAFAKIDTPVHWKFASTKIDQDKYAVSFTADIDNGWHLYSQFLKSGGPVPTSFKFDQTRGLSLAGKVTEKPAALSGFDQSFQMTICYHEHQVTFTQIVNTKDTGAHLTGSLNYMVCSGQKCLPPTGTRRKARCRTPRLRPGYKSLYQFFRSRHKRSKKNIINSKL